MYYNVSENIVPYSTAVQNAMAGTTFQVMLYPGITAIPVIIAPGQTTKIRTNVCQVVYDFATGTNRYVCTSGRYVNPVRTRNTVGRQSY